MKRFLLLFGSITFIIVSCSKVPVTGRKQVRLLPESMILSMSLTNYQEFIQKNPPVSAGDANSQLVKSVGSKLSSAATQYMNKNGFSKRTKEFRWEFNLINDKTVNAWCMPGGKIVVYSGILPVTKDEAGLATVISHEIAHAVARHGNERMSQQLAVQMGGISLALAMQQKPEQTRNIFLSVYGVGSTLGVLAYSRQHEYEADKIGMVFMALAGYDPSLAIGFWERMEQLSGGQQIPQFLSTHPSDNNRIQAMKQFLPTAMKYYKKNA